MNFLDTYDITGSNTPPTNQPEKSLNEEAKELAGQIGRLWGGFRRQSQSTFASVVSQAQKELGKLAEPAGPSSPSSSGVATQARDSSSEAGPSSPTSTIKPEDDGPAHPRDSIDSNTTAVPASSTSGLQNLFSRLQSSLPPNVVAAVQNNLPESVRHAAVDGIDFAHLRSSFTTEFQRVQGLTRAQAEEYVHKSEGFLKEALKEASEALKDVVKVIPPDQQQNAAAAITWDGMDTWMLPTFLASSQATGETETGASTPSGRASVDASLAVATRTESLLKRLKENPEILKIDPEADDTVRPQYQRWKEEQLGGTIHFLEDDRWKKNTQAALGPELQTTHDQLVPGTMTEETFWQRYFFRTYQIELDEKKRKALLQGSLETNEEAFSWEDEDEDEEEEEEDEEKEKEKPKEKKDEDEEDEEDEESDEEEEDEEEDEDSSSGSEESSSDESDKPSTTAPSEKVVTPTQAPGQKALAPTSQPQTPANTSPRESEDSYDVVSSANASVAGETKAPPTKGEDSDEDSDWE